LKPLSYPDADRIVEFLLTSPDGNDAIASIPKFQNWQRQSSVFKDVAAYDFSGPGFNITDDRPEQVHGIHVSESYFRVFGAQSCSAARSRPRKTRPTAAGWWCSVMACGSANSAAIPR
ncbi:MAG: hypothetical protein WBF42_00470, partial [Terracidiphilus sp.]